MLCIGGRSRQSRKMNLALLQLQGVEFGYARTPVLSGADLCLAGSNILTICGPSGCGKTTLLLILGGLLEPTSGRRVLSQQLKPHKIIYVPQQDVLLPWLSLRRNVQLGREITGNGALMSDAELSASLNIHTFLDKTVESLSGGMRKRACLARAFSAGPSIVLLDEPFNNLDFLDRRSVEAFLKKWVSQGERAAVCVTHDIEQAVALGDRVGYFHRNAGNSAADAMRFDVMAVPSALVSLSTPERRGHSDFNPFVRRIEGFFFNE